MGDGPGSPILAKVPGERGVARIGEGASATGNGRDSGGSEPATPAAQRESRARRRPERSAQPQTRTQSGERSPRSSAIGAQAGLDADPQVRRSPSVLHAWTPRPGRPSTQGLAATPGAWTAGALALNRRESVSFPSTRGGRAVVLKTGDGTLRLR